MKDEKQLIEELNKLNTNFRAAVDKFDEEKKTLVDGTAETRALVDKLTGEMTDLMAQIKEVRAIAEAPPPAKEDEMDEAAALHHRAMDKFLRKGIRSTALEPEELRVLSEASDADGAFLAPTEMEAGILMTASNLAVMRGLVNVQTTSRESVTQNALSKPIISWGQELLEVSEQTLQAGMNKIDIKKCMGLYIVSNDLLDDAEADIVGELSGAFGRVIGEAEDVVIATGDGVNQPKGFLTDTDVLANYTPTGVAAALSDGSNNGMDMLINALAALKGTYRTNSTWVFNSATMGKIMQFKDSYGQYLWQPMMQQGAPAMLLGRPTAVNEGMPDIAANTYPICLADFSTGYKLKDRSGLAFKRLDEKYATYDQVGFIVKKRLGGKTTLAECFRVIKVATS